MTMDSKGLNRLFQCCEELRKLEDQMPMQKVATLILIAMHEGVTMKQLAEWTGTSQASCSRNLAALGEVHRLGKPGLGLVVTKEDPVEPRRKVAFLTPRGRRVISSLLEHLGVPE